MQYLICSRKEHPFFAWVTCAYTCAKFIFGIGRNTSDSSFCFFFDKLLCFDCSIPVSHHKLSFIESSFEILITVSCNSVFFSQRLISFKQRMLNSWNDDINMFLQLDNRNRLLHACISANKFKAAVCYISWSYSYTNRNSLQLILIVLPAWTLLIVPVNFYFEWNSYITKIFRINNK